MLLLLLASCNKNSGNKGIDLNVTILPETITDSLYIKMNYQFTLSQKFSPAQFNDNYKIFVHFWRMNNKEMLLVDDHSPETKISQWKAGDKVTYSRMLFIPAFLDEFDVDFEGYEEVKLTVGIYNPANEKDKIVLLQRVEKVQAASLNAPEMVYDDGWNQPETDARIPDPNVRTWRWTKKKAVCIIENPRKEARLIIRGGVDKSIIPDQSVVFKINETVLDKFIPETAKFSKEYVIPSINLGAEDEFKLTIETDKTFIPSALNKEVNDDRELGIQVFFLYFRENIKW